jgi:hypothetical protein
MLFPFVVTVFVTGARLSQCHSAGAEPACGRRLAVWSLGIGPDVAAVADRSRPLVSARVRIVVTTFLSQPAVCHSRCHRCHSSRLTGRSDSAPQPVCWVQAPSPSPSARVFQWCFTMLLTPPANIAAERPGSAWKLISAARSLPPSRARACRRSYSPSERLEMVRRASGSGRSASRVIGTGSRSLSSLRIAG